MQINGTSDYAVALILTLARNQKPMTSKELGACIDVSPYYIQQILAKLRNRGLVGSKRGSSNGGYQLLKDPRDISVLDVVEPFENTMYVNQCLEEGAETEAPVYRFWERMQQSCIAQMKSTSVYDLMVG
ncbi:MAG: Rrf2 family transcriptional regulator [Clostridia bacterium]|nr:Rrf2 family transcriptional regulator [Clostridia bacterium]